MGAFTYITEFLKDKEVGQINAPSKAGIVQICKNIDFSKDQVFVELGAKAGELSRYLLWQMTLGSKLVVFETNPRFLEILHRINDSRLIIIEEKADELSKHFPNLKVDYIICGLPFTLIRKSRRRAILVESKHVLKSDGKFVMYQYSNSMKNELKKTFPITQSRLVAATLPFCRVLEAYQ